MEKDPFKEYLREAEPDKAHKGYAWSTAIGLQAVDGLKPSKYLIDTAIQNIEGKITMKEAQSLIDSYYEERPVLLSGFRLLWYRPVPLFQVPELSSRYFYIHHRMHVLRW